MKKIREMSEKQFKAAAARQGFTLTLGAWLTDPELGLSVGAIVEIGARGALKKVYFREWLAKAIRERNRLRRERGLF